MLFAHVDDQRRNAINGQQAVAFFARSHLDKAILREVWSIADSQRRSELSRNEFYVAMRLISMAQRGEQVSAQRFFQLATMQYPLPMMEGVPPPQQQPVQPQAQMHAPQQDFGSVHQQPTGSYALTTDEKSKYDIVFQQYDTDRDGFLMGTEAVALFQMSGLDRNMLRDIWSMADVTQDSKLSVQEFYVAMHLIVCVSKRGLPMPSTLPRELSETAFGSGGSAAKNDSSSGFEAFEDFNAAPASTDSAGASDAPKATNPSGNSPFSPIATDNSGFGDFGDFNSAPAPTASSTETKSAEVSGNSPFSPVSTDNGFGDFGDFNAAPTSTDNAKPTTRKESTDSNAFETFGDFSAAPSSTSDVGNFN
ncbi:hypothetical protein AM588_10009798 [Phytophthora nicotianae]|uniref:Calmodulin n=1 Tax=Phytophthora nicotianae TaxID=4792 RepID=A0A0W8DN66_PHYNI|nr:hypothetical protein AM588_10009798 [Phytophthora nicotianae]